ncbi:MAG TPA: alpha/beta hydrolase [Burkholderiales bacterium]|nr:alpha/beta hydrolase [Burkholderiales bacterium]
MRPMPYLVPAGDAQIETIAEGKGPPVVILPSRGRGARDYDGLARRISGGGYRVLRPQPRGIGGSRGPMRGLTLHDLARDVAAVIAHAGAGPALVVGHAFGSWVARMTAADFPRLVRGVAILAAAAKEYPAALAEAVTKCADPSLPAAERLKYLQFAFFAPGHDASEWLEGFFPEVNASQRAAGLATPQEAWWGAGGVPLLDLQAEHDAFRPRATAGDLREELGERVSVALVAGAGHALVPEQPEAVAVALLAWMRKVAG